MLVTMSESPASAGATGSASAAGATAGVPSSAADDFSLQSDATERSLLPQAVAGDQAAFDRLVTVHQDRIARLVQRLLGWPSDVDDVVQDVFVDALRNLRRFDGRSSVLTWLTRLTINRCRSHQRRQWIRLSFLRIKCADVRATGSISASDTSNLAITKETIHQVHAAIRQLNQKDREIIVLRYLEEVPIEDIMKTLNLTRTAADVRLTRARQRLETILKPILDK
jgi:RNA polymerase sigma-70 factor (ECF subfamily)